MAPLLDKFIPEEIRNNPKIRRSARLIIAIDLVILMLSFVLSACFTYIHFTVGMYTMLFSATCATLFPILLYQTKNLELAGHFFSFASLSVFMGMSIGTGGIQSPFLVWFLTIPPIGFFYMKRKQAVLWTSMTICSVLLLFISSVTGLGNFAQLPAVYIPYVMLFNFLMVLWLYTAVIQSFSIGFRRMNAKLESSNDRLQQSNKELERFAYIASHDLKSPLRIISSFIHLFENHYDGRLDKVGQEYLRFIDRSARQMNRLIEDILEYSKTNNRELNRETVDLSEVVRQIVQEIKLSKQYPEANVQYDKLPVIQTDQTKLYQLLKNLIENGLKYNKSKEPKVSVGYFLENEQHHFTIKDNGIGIAAQHSEQIFEMFKRLHTRDTYQGTGIGLAICKKIVDAFDGKIWLESIEGEGATFHICLPKMTYETSEQEAVKELEAV